MELEHQDMLTWNFVLRKKKILHLCSPIILHEKGIGIKNCLNRFGDEFEKRLNSYQRLLDEIQGGASFNLNNITVLLSRLDFLEKINTHPLTTIET
jgi:hypothetical protein